MSRGTFFCGWRFRGALRPRPPRSPSLACALVAVPVRIWVRCRSAQIRVFTGPCWPALGALALRVGVLRARMKKRNRSHGHAHAPVRGHHSPSGPPTASPRPPHGLSWPSRAPHGLPRPLTAVTAFQNSQGPKRRPCQKLAYFWCPKNGRNFARQGVNPDSCGSPPAPQIVAHFLGAKMGRPFFRAQKSQ